MNLGIMKLFHCAGKAVLPKIPKWIAKSLGLDLIADVEWNEQPNIDRRPF